MTRNLENPFAGYGSIIYGERFTGRHNSLRVLESRIIHSRRPMSTAIISEARVGKSSLAYNFIMQWQKELITNRVVPIWINLATYNQVPAFLDSLVHLCCDELENLGWLSAGIEHAAKRFLSHLEEGPGAYHLISRFFKEVRRTGAQILFVLDEFDYARSLFKDAIPIFSFLRELVTRPDIGVAFITISRLTLDEIEPQHSFVSTFAGVFYPLFLSMFDEADVQECLHRLSSVGLPTDDDVRRRVRFYCGGHPYLLEMLGYEIVEVFREQQQIDVDLAAERIEQSILRVYDDLIARLHEKGQLDKLLQILSGSDTHVERRVANNLLCYGLIKLSENRGYVAFSEHFELYLNSIGTEAGPTVRGIPIERPHPSETELASLCHQLSDARENLRLIQERKSQYVLEATNVPLHLIKEEQYLLKHTEELNQRIKEVERASQRWQSQLWGLPSQWYLNQLLQILDERFNEGELQTLCFHLNIDYDNLPGKGKTNKARELIEYVGRRMRILELVESGRRLRPDILWPEVATDV